ncbi:MAG: hypothetical protein LBB08_00095 [Rickettsiales bacterium]|jgi:hypothetical protein|nr:hypothetical protein [Rickettsiales bacterium]
MKDMNMPADQMDRIMHKMYHKKRVLFRAFLINLALVVAVYLLNIAGVFSAEWMGRMMMCPAAEAEHQVMNLLGLWKIAGVVFFLVPALAMWWECNCIKKQQ